MVIRAEHITKEFIRKSHHTNVLVAVKECDLTIRGGGLTVIKGRSGSGKSTLINMLSGILTPTSGGVYYNDIDIYRMSDDKLSSFRNKSIGYIPQGKSAIASLSVLDNILLPITLYRKPNDGDIKRANLLMAEMDIAELSGAKANELSGGELRRMAIARALINEPEAVFADEPTGDLDDENTKKVFEILRSYAKRGAAVLIITHESEADNLADRLYTMDAGVLR